MALLPGEAKNLVTIAGVPFELFQNEIVKTWAVFNTTVGGFISAIGGGVLSGLASKMQYYGLAKAGNVGPEIFYMVYATNVSMRQVYYAHRLYSFVRGYVGTFTRQGEKVVAERVYNAFEPDDVIIDDVFEQQIVHSLFMGLAAGTMIRLLSHRPFIASKTRRFLIKRLYKVPGDPSWVITNAAGQTGVALAPPSGLGKRIWYPL